MKRIMASGVAGVATLVCGLALSGEADVWIDRELHALRSLRQGWDTEGTGREKTNLLRLETVVGLRIGCAGQCRNGIDLPTAGTRTPAARPIGSRLRRRPKSCGEFDRPGAA